MGTQTWPGHKKVKGHPGIIIWTNLVDLESSMLQSNLNSSNTDGSFTMANSNSFLSPYEIQIDQENKYFRKLSYFIIKLYV